MTFNLNFQSELLIYNSFNVKKMAGKIRWEYQVSASKWACYDDDVADFLNTNYDSGKDKITRDIADWTAQFDFKKMRQKNLDSKFERNFRCSIQGSDGEYYAWDFMDGRRYQSFPVNLLSDLEKGFLAYTTDNSSPTLEIEIKNEKMRIDFSNNIMTNPSGSQIKVRRQKSSAEMDITNGPVPSQSSTSIRERSQRIAAASQKGKKKTSVAKEAKAKGKKKSAKTLDFVGTSTENNAKNESDSDDEKKKNSEQSKIKGKKRAAKGSDDESAISEDDAKAGPSKRKKSEGKCKSKMTNKRKKVVEDEEEESDAVSEQSGKENKSKDNKESEKAKPVKRNLVDELNAPGESDYEAEVDIECVQKLGKAHVYREGKIIYDVMLNQTNIQNNNNKFFLLQVLEDDDTTKSYSTWFRWGRVGFRGQSDLTHCGFDVESAILRFKQKFYDKTRNNFDDLANFQKVSGKYDIIRVDYTKKRKEEHADIPEKTKNKIPKSELKIESKLDPAVQRLMQLICDVKSMEAEIRNMEYDVNKAPLGKITKAQIKAGYEALTKIEDFIKKGQFGSDFMDAVNVYYTRIPHCFGMRPPTPIRTIAQLKNEIELLETLCGIEIAMTAINEEMAQIEKQRLHPVDKHYSHLNWHLEPMDQKDQMFELIDRYLQSTHGGTHNRYKMKLKNVYELKEKNERPFKAELGNRRLLWHGSRISNWYGILSQGLRIAPPEAPVTGYMFGKGVYFADASSKSANYTYPEPGKPGFLVLADVALGNMNDLINANERANELPEGKHSVCGMGKTIPDPSNTIMLEDGVMVPCGKLIEKKNKNSLYLAYNEYIVYDTSQIRERYLVEVDFDFEFKL